MLALLAQFVLLTVAVLLAMIASTWDVLLVLPSLLTMYILIATAEGKDANSKVTTKGEKCFVPVSSSAIETPHESGVQGEIAESSAEGKHERTRTTRKRGNQRKCMVPTIEELMAALEELARVSTSATKPGAECTIATEEVAEGEGAEGAVAKDKQDETSGPATGETADDKAFAARAIERSHAKQSLDISVKIFTHRTSVRSNGKPVVEYGCAVAAASGIESSQSWHRYTDFAELHAKISGELGISPRFCCPKGLHIHRRPQDGPRYRAAGVLGWLPAPAPSHGQADAGGAARVPLHADHHDVHPVHEWPLDAARGRGRARARHPGRARGAVVTGSGGVHFLCIAQGALANEQGALSSLA